MTPLALSASISFSLESLPRATTDGEEECHGQGEGQEGGGGIGDEQEDVLELDALVDDEVRHFSEAAHDQDEGEYGQGQEEKKNELLEQIEVELLAENLVRFIP